MPKDETPKSASVRLVLDVTYDLNGVQLAVLTQLLEQGVARLIQDGGLTAETPVEVGSYTMNVQEVPGSPTEEELGQYFDDAIADGVLCLGDVPDRLARYGLMDPVQFTAEMRERMGLED